MRDMTSQLFKSVLKYKEFLEKMSGDDAPEDPEHEHERWALLANKGYAGAEAHVKALISK